MRSSAGTVHGDYGNGDANLYRQRPLSGRFKVTIRLGGRRRELTLESERRLDQVSPGIHLSWS